MGGAEGLPRPTLLVSQAVERKLFGRRRECHRSWKPLARPGRGTVADEVMVAATAPPYKVHTDFVDFGLYRISKKFESAELRRPALNSIVGSVDV